MYFSQLFSSVAYLRCVLRCVIFAIGCHIFYVDPYYEVLVYLITSTIKLLISPQKMPYSSNCDSSLMHIVTMIVH